MNKFSLSFWTNERRNEFLERAGLYLLYAFILSLCSNPFIMFFIGLDKFNYVTIESSIDGKVPYIYDLSPDQLSDINKYKLVDSSFVEKQKEFERYIGWIGFTGLLGWCVTSPRFMNGWPKLVDKFKQELKLKGL